MRRGAWWSVALSADGHVSDFHATLIVMVTCLELHSASSSTSERGKRVRNACERIESRVAQRRHQCEPWRVGGAIQPTQRITLGADVARLF